MIKIIAKRYKGQEVVDSHNRPHPERTRPSEIFLLMLLKKKNFFFVRLPPLLKVSTSNQRY